MCVCVGRCVCVLYTDYDVLKHVSGLGRYTGSSAGSSGVEFSY